VLACKGCRNECPVNVDMATYKAEFLAHYYAGRLRPRSAYTMGLIYWWARLASHIPGVANFFAHARPFSSLMKGIANVAPERTLPRFASPPFTKWFRRRPRAISSEDGGRRNRKVLIRHAVVPVSQRDVFQDNGERISSNRHPPLNQSDSKRVLLWPDTFTNYFRPQAAMAAVEVLEDAGFEVAIPPRPLCCGRPLYDLGHAQDRQTTLAADARCAPAGH
jgi:Fe-S oxidoreductase